MTEGKSAETIDDGRGWRRALALLAVALGMSVVQPTVLIALPLLGLLMIRRAGGRAVLGRKPAPGMILQAASDLDLDLNRCWMIGDQMRDIIED